MKQRVNDFFGHLNAWAKAPEFFARGQCVGGPKCCCCGAGCDCGCRDDCPVWKAMKRTMEAQS